MVGGNGSTKHVASIVGWPSNRCRWPCLIVPRTCAVVQLGASLGKHYGDPVFLNTLAPTIRGTIMAASMLGVLLVSLACKDLVNLQVVRPSVMQLSTFGIGAVLIRDVTAMTRLSPCLITVGRKVPAY